MFTSVCKQTIGLQSIEIVLNIITLKCICHLLWDVWAISNSSEMRNLSGRQILTTFIVCLIVLWSCDRARSLDYWSLFHHPRPTLREQLLVNHSRSGECTCHCRWLKIVVQLTALVNDLCIWNWRWAVKMYWWYCKDGLVCSKTDLRVTSYLWYNKYYITYEQHCVVECLFE